MKKNSILFLLVLLGLVFPGTRLAGQQTVAVDGFPNASHHPGLQQLLDSKGLTGVILVFDPAAGTLFSNNLQAGSDPHLPASTFKVPNTIIALETGVVADENTLFEWDGKPRALSYWERDMVLREAFHRSCVPCYQQIAQETGVERMKYWLELLDFGDMKVNYQNITTFWLEGNSRITPLQQLDFMTRLYHKQLPIQARTYAIMKNLMVIEEHPQWRLSGKSGWAIRQGNNTGWFTGYLENQDRVYFVVTCIKPGEDYEMALFNQARQQVSLEALKVLEIIGN